MPRLTLGKAPAIIGDSRIRSPLLVQTGRELSVSLELNSSRAIKLVHDVMLLRCHSGTLSFNCKGWFLIYFVNCYSKYLVALTQGRWHKLAFVPSSLIAFGTMPILSHLSDHDEELL